MAGATDLTPAMDVYAYAICCIEILLMGRMPWPLSTDDDVRRFVLGQYRDKPSCRLFDLCDLQMMTDALLSLRFPSSIVQLCASLSKLAGVVIQQGDRRLRRLSAR